MAGLLAIDDTLNLTNASIVDIATNQAADTNVALAGSIAPDATVVGSSTNFSTYGRSTLNLSNTSYPDGLLSAASIMYVIDANTSYLISAPINTYEPLYSGYVAKQNGSFTAASLSGSALGYGRSQADGSLSDFSGDTLSLYGTSDAFLALYSADGEGTISVLKEVNSAGTILSSQASSSTYSVAPNGRVSLSGSGTPVFWLSGPNQGFGTTMPSWSGPWPTLITLEPQAAAPFSNASLSGSLMLGVENTRSYLSLLESGQLTADGAGNLAGAADCYTDGGLQQYGSSPITDTGTYQLSANGRGTISLGLAEGATTVGTESLVFYMISPTRVVAIDTAAGDQSPSILVLDGGVAPALVVNPCSITLHRQTGIHPDC